LTDETQAADRPSGAGTSAVPDLRFRVGQVLAKLRRHLP
jgi:hypothetical protein